MSSPIRVIRGFFLSFYFSVPHFSVERIDLGFTAKGRKEMAGLTPGPSPEYGREEEYFPPGLRWANFWAFGSNIK